MKFQSLPAEFMNKHTEELQQNELVEWLNKHFGHLRPHLNQILLGALAVVAVIFAVMFYLKSRAEWHASQWQLLSSSINAHLLDGQASHFVNMADEYPDAEASMWALLLAGDVELRNGLSKLNSDPQSAARGMDKAEKSYQRLLDSNVKKSPALMQRAVYSLAYAQESLGKFEDAKKTYQRILDEAGGSIYVEPATMALERLNDPDLVAFYDAYKKTSIAPMGDLPRRPDISFPEPVDPPSGVQPPNNGDANSGAVEKSPPPTTPDGNSVEPAKDGSPTAAEPNPEKKDGGN